MSFYRVVVLPWEVLGETVTPDGTALALTRRGSEYVILANGKSLMSNRMHGSEEALADFGMRHLASLPRHREPHVLVGGLGPTDRDQMTFGVPILGQIANALADAGYVTLRGSPFAAPRMMVVGGVIALVITLLQLNRARRKGEIVSVLQKPEVRERFFVAGSEVIGSSPSQFAATIKSEMAKWGKVVKASGARID